MALSNPRSIYGIHSVAPYNTSSGEFYGILKVLGDSSLNLSGELNALNGGSSPYPYAVEQGVITTEVNLVFREYPDFVFELFLGKAPTSNAAEASGSTTALVNKTGTSVFNGTTGIATITVESGDEADVKFTKYAVVAASATTVDLYAGSDVDFARGTDLDYQNDLLKITTSPLTVADSGGTTSIPGTGLEITGGSGTVAMTSGDTAVFSSRPVNQGSMDVVIGGSSDVFPEFGAIMLANQRGNGAMFEVDMFRMKAVGLPIGLAENAYGEVSVAAQGFRDSCRNGVFSIRTVEIASSVC
jgi:hypothetical protein